MKFLDYLQNITDSDEEFLAIVQEMNKWVDNEKDERRFIHMPHNLKRFDFSREEYRQAFEFAEKAIQGSKSHQHHKQKLSQYGESQKSSSDLLFYGSKNLDSIH